MKDGVWGISTGKDIPEFRIVVTEFYVSVWIPPFGFPQWAPKLPTRTSKIHKQRKNTLIFIIFVGKILKFQNQRTAKKIIRHLHGLLKHLYEQVAILNDITRARVTDKSIYILN